MNSRFGGHSPSGALCGPRTSTVRQVKNSFIYHLRTHPSPTKTTSGPSEASFASNVGKERDFLLRLST